MSFVHKVLHPATTVDHCCTANFTGPTDENLIVVKTNILEVYTLLKVCCSFCTHKHMFTNARAHSRIHTHVHIHSLCKFTSTPPHTFIYIHIHPHYYYRTLLFTFKCRVRKVMNWCSRIPSNCAAQSSPLQLPAFLATNGNLCS